MFLDVRRPDCDSSSEAEIVRRFAARFREKDWPGTRMPELYYDPRSTDLDPSRRASLHAKCIVVDETQSFVSSANFTEAAQLRNIEVGLLVRSPALSRQLIQHFETLAAESLLRPIPLG
jgi:phosphatidylserine/phosphatidylglycerophosphate/cardiolipin synthase-like enzyme